MGEPIACVIASSRYVAEDALQLIDVEYEPLPVITDPHRALASDAPLLHEGTERNSFAHIEFENGDVEGAFAAADRVVTKRFHHGRFHPAPLEGRAIAADWDAGTQELTVWLSTQVPHLARTLLCHSIGLTEKQPTRDRTRRGRRFGLKLHLWPEDYLVGYAAKHLGRPVKWIEDRSESLAASLHAKEMTIELELALKADGTFLAMTGRYVGDSGAYASYPWTPLVDTLCAAVMLPNLYDVGAVRYEIDAAYTNKCPSGAYRGVGWTSGQTAREALIDDAARELGMDRWSSVLKNTIPDEPYESATGCRYDGGSYAEAQRKAMELIDYPGFRERQARSTRGRTATSASASAPSSSRAVGQGSWPSAWASPSTTWMLRASPSSPMALSWSRSGCTRTARPIRPRWRRSSPTSWASRSIPSRSSRATRRRPRTAPARSAAEVR